MGKTSILAILLFFAFTACRKKTTPYTTMTANVAGDTTWTTTDVTTENDNAIVYVNATNVILNKRITLILNHYEAGKNTFTIGNTGTTNINFSQSGAQYISESTEEDATSGQITITGHTTNTIIGVFDFEGNNVHVTGTFTAPAP